MSNWDLQCGGMGWTKGYELRGGWRAGCGTGHIVISPSTACLVLGTFVDRITSHLCMVSGCEHGYTEVLVTLEYQEHL